MLQHKNSLREQMLSILIDGLEKETREVPKFKDWLPTVTPNFTWDWPHLVYVQNMLEKVSRREILKLAIFMPPRHGKQIEDGTPILTTKGWSTHGKLKVGDYVYHPSGKPIKVTGISNKTESDIAITFTNNETVICHENHEWTVYDRSRGEWHTYETNYWLQGAGLLKPDGSCVYQLQNISPVEFNEQSLLLDPYFFGSWLGDGVSNKPDIVPLLEEIGVYGNKHIPNNYIYSSVEQRKSLIAGLIDTEGIIEIDGSIRIVNANKSVIDGAYQVLLSLAQRPSIAKDGVVYNISFHPTINFPTMIYKESLRTISQEAIGIQSVERIKEVGTGHCIQVDSPDGLYLVGANLIPTHNSEMTTIRFPVWWLERDPTSNIIITAYNQTLASKFSRNIRKIARHRISISSEKKAADEWETDAGGMVRAAGVGSGVTGMGGNLIIIDDPVKSRAEAKSLAYRNRCYEWYRDDLYTRREKDTPIVLIQTRWHEDDLAGRILETENDWTVISLPALAEEGDLLGREPGEALCPDRFNKEQLEEIQSIMGRTFAALYQQRPVEQEGGFFKRTWFSFTDTLPEGSYDFCRYWDKAGTDDGDYTCGVLMARNFDTGLYYVVDVVRDKLTSHLRDQMIKNVSEKDRKRYGHVRIRHEQEPGSAGLDAARQTTKLLEGFPVRAIRSTGSKEVRAEPFQAQCEGGNVILVKAGWNRDYIEELTSFPQGKFDDQVDGSSGAFNELATNRAVIIPPRA